MKVISEIKDDIKIGGVVFTLFYIFSTAILPNVVFRKKLIKMNKISVFFWWALIILWQVFILYSFYKYFYDKPSEYDIYTYRLFIEGGWYNFQKWLSFYAEDIFQDILLLAIVLLIPFNITQNISRETKVLLIFGKLGLFLVITYFILGPPSYNIKKQELTLTNYFDTVMKFKGDTNDGILRYMNTNKIKIMKIIFSIILILLVYFRPFRNINHFKKKII